MSDEQAGLTFIETENNGIYAAEGDIINNAEDLIEVGAKVLTFSGWRAGALKIEEDAELPEPGFHLIRISDIISAEYVS